MPSEISATTSGIANPGAAQSGTSAAASKAPLSSDFETFLRMLTVQLQNQDPLNPVEASDYAVQLATFSGVEQQVKTNDLLSALGERLDTLGVGEFASWIGMEARYSGKVHYSGTPVDFQADPVSGSDAAFLVVRDRNNNLVAREPLTLQPGQHQWTGTGITGAQQADGMYYFFVESVADGTPIDTSPAEVFDVVNEAALVDGEVVLTLSGGNRIDADLVAGLRNPYMCK